MTFFWTQATSFQRRGKLVFALCGLYHRIGKPLTSCRRAVAWFCILSFGFWVLFGWILLTCSWSDASFCSISWAWQAISSLFAACGKNCWSVYLFTIASPRSFLSRIVCRILLRITSSGSMNPHLATWRRKRMWYWASDSPSFWCILSNLLWGWPWEWNGCRAWQWFFRIHLTAQLMTV